MKPGIRKWLTCSREKLKTAPLDEADLDRLETLLADQRRVTLYLTARSPSMRSKVVGWALYDPTQNNEPRLMSDEPPYASVLDAVADGWHVAQYPVSNLYSYKDLENDYVGFDFILEKWV